MEQLAKIVEQGPGAVVAFAFLGLLYWLLVRFTKAFDHLEGAIDLNTSILLGLQSQLLTHDLTVSGLNPAAGSTIDERTNRAYAKYTEVQRQIEEARELILARTRRAGGGS